MKNSRNKQFINFKLLTVLSSMLKSQVILLRPALDVTQPSVQCLHSANAPCPTATQHSYGIACLGMAVPVFKSSLFYLIMAPKCKSSDAGTSALQKRSCKLLLLSRMAKVLNLKKKKLYAEVAEIYRQSEFPIGEIVKKEIHATSAVTSQTAKVMSVVCVKCLVKMENALSLWTGDVNRKRVLTDCTVLGQKPLSL